MPSDDVQQPDCHSVIWEYLIDQVDIEVLEIEAKAAEDLDPPLGLLSLNFEGEAGWTAAQALEERMWGRGEEGWELVAIPAAMSSPQVLCCIYKRRRRNDDSQA